MPPNRAGGIPVEWGFAGVQRPLLSTAGGTAWASPQILVIPLKIGTGHRALDPGHV